MVKEKTKAKKIHHVKHSKKENEEKIVLNNNAIKVAKKIFWNEKALIVLLILIAIGFSTFFRMYPASLPITHQWAEDTYYNQIKAGISQQISQQYPHLPAAQKQAEINKQFQQYLEEHKSELEPQIEQTANYFKSRMQNDDGQTYLLAIDPYFYLRQADHYETLGRAGTTYIGGDKPIPENVKLLYKNLDPNKKNDWDAQRLAPIGSPTYLNAHTVVISWIHKIFKIFGSKDLMKAAFYVPVIISALAVIFAFLLGRKIAGNVGGFFSAMLLAIHPAFLNRTVAGFSDTDPYNVLFPLAIVWLIVEALSKEKIKDKLIWSGIAGITTAIFALFWMWWFIFAIVLGAIGLYIIIQIIKELQTKKKAKELIRNKKIINEIYGGIGYFISTGIFVSLFKGINGFLGGLLAPLHATQLKTVGFDSVWPNILTTVAELNSASIKSTIAAMGGTLLFVLGIIGIILTLIKMDKNDKLSLKSSLILILWFAVTIYASTKGVRFNLLLVPAFAVAFGVFAGKIYQQASKWLGKQSNLMKIGTQVVIIIVMLLLLIQPIKAANSQSLHEVPSMNDGWYNTLTKIKTESQPNAIMNSWWDFGHWFITIANRSATFDGAGQDRHMAYWVGRSLTSNNPKLTTGILRMVDCGNNNAFYQLNEYLNNSDKSIKILNEIVLLNKSTAKTELEKNGLNNEESSKVLQYTHCQAPEDYYIVSDDMIGKAGVWAHFGNWNFTKATIYYIAKHYDETEGINKIVQDLGLSDDRASELYYDANSLASNRDVDTWMSPWPNYLTTKASSCKELNKTIYCQIGKTISSNGQTRTVISQSRTPIDKPEETSLLIASTDNTGVVLGTQEIKPMKVSIGTEKGWKTTKIENNSFPYELSIAMIDNQTIKAILADDLVSDSSFTKLFFFEGLGMKGYEKFSEENTFTGGKIIVYKVNVNEK